MVYNHLAGNFTTPQQRRPSDPTWSKSTLRTTSSGKKSDPRTAGSPRTRASPYMKPDEVKIELSPGNSCPMEIFTPKDHMAKLALRRKAASSTSSPMTPMHPHVASSTNELGESPLFGRPKRIVFPPSVVVREPSPELVSPPMQGTPRRVERPRVPDPIVQLLRVMYKCWDDDTQKESDWTLTDGLLNGRNDERDRRGTWSLLGRAVYKVWRDRNLHGWIILNRPSDNDTTWFKSAGGIGFNDEEYIDNLEVDQKDSTLDRVGFHSS